MGGQRKKTLLQKMTRGLVGELSSNSNRQSAADPYGDDQRRLFGLRRKHKKNKSSGGTAGCSGIRATPCNAMSTSCGVALMDVVSGVAACAADSLNSGEALCESGRGGRQQEEGDVEDKPVGPAFFGCVPGMDSDSDGDGPETTTEKTAETTAEKMAETMRRPVGSEAIGVRREEGDGNDAEMRHPVDPSADRTREAALPPASRDPSPELEEPREPDPESELEEPEPPHHAMEECNICLEVMDFSDVAHPIRCPTSCGYNFCAYCIRRLINSSHDDFDMASDGNKHVKVRLLCPQCRGEIHSTLTGTLLLRRNARLKAMMSVPDYKLSAAQLRLKYDEEESDDDLDSVDEFSLSSKKKRESKFIRHLAVMYSTRASAPGEDAVEVDEHDDRIEALTSDVGLLRLRHGTPLSPVSGGDSLYINRDTIAPSERSTQSHDVSAGLQA